MSPISNEIKNAVADDLLRALENATPINPVRERLNSDLNVAYEVQELLVKKQESPLNPRVGRKIGLTSKSVQKQLGVDQPDFGVLLKDMQLGEGQVIDTKNLISARIEAELAFVISKDVEDFNDVLNSIESVHPALEIVDSRIIEWDIEISDTVADNASCGSFIISEKGYSVDEIDTVNTKMTLEVNGEIVSEGSGAACMDDPKNALVWVAETSHRLGRPLRAGEIVLSGALGPMVSITEGLTIKANFSNMQSLETRTV